MQDKVAAYTGKLLWTPPGLEEGEVFWTPPGAIDGHYLGMYLWDSCYSAMVYAKHGFIKEAEQEFEVVMASQNVNTGMMPNMARIVPRPWFKELEWRYFPDEKFSSYSQAPMMAEVAMSIYNSKVDNGSETEAIEFLEKYYPRLVYAYDYFINTRENSPFDPLVFNIHTNETGRDSDPTFDYIKKLIPRNWPLPNGVIDKINPALDQRGVRALAIKNNKVNWEPRHIRNHFFLNDVMFNCKYYQNLATMSEVAAVLGKENDMVRFGEKADDVQSAILDKMWDPHARDHQGQFFGLNQFGHIQETTISNLYPITLPNISEKQVASCFNLFEQAFNTEFPIPSVATDSPKYDPHYKQKGVMWKGGTWWWTNSDIKEGFYMQSTREDLSPELARRCLQVSQIVTESSAKLVLNSRSEFSNPITGEGQRRTNFSGAAIGFPTDKDRSRGLINNELFQRVMGVKLGLLM